MDISVVAEKVAIALGLGLLVGLQRERVQSPLAGIRTFALITPSRIWQIMPPLASMAASMAAISLGMYWFAERDPAGLVVHDGAVESERNARRASSNKAELPLQANPAELKTAILFAVLYALVRLGIAAARDHLGDIVSESRTEGCGGGDPGRSAALQMDSVAVRRRISWCSGAADFLARFVSQS